MPEKWEECDILFSGQDMAIALMNTHISCDYLHHKGPNRILDAGRPHNSIPVWSPVLPPETVGSECVLGEGDIFISVVTTEERIENVSVCKCIMYNIYLL